MTGEEVAQFIQSFVDTPQKDQAIENYRRLTIGLE